MLEKADLYLGAGAEEVRVVWESGGID